MSEKRYQVFVSSTFLDLKDERREVYQALLELDCFPAGMEIFPAASEDQWNYIKKVIDDSDYYLVIIGGRYGSTDQDGLSYTEKEYDYAISKQIPVIAFLHEDPLNLEAKRVELNAAAQEKLAAFRQKVQTKLCKQWATSSDLGGVVSRSLIKLIKAQPREGWVRGNYASDFEELAKLRARIAQLEDDIERERTGPPQGTEEYASGGDTHPLKFTFRYDEIVGEDELLGYPLTKTRTASDSLLTTWDQLFTTLGPYLFEEHSEQGLQNAISSLISRNKSLPHSGYGIEIADSDFHTIIAQFLALGLIRKSDKKHAPSDSNTYWKLTPYGETVVQRLKAIRKSK